MKPQPNILYRRFLKSKLRESGIVYDDNDPTDILIMKLSKIRTDEKAI